jgi:hypothetical protein
MKTLIVALLLLAPAVALGQTRTIYFDYSDGKPVVVSDTVRDSGIIYIRNGSKAVLELSPPQYGAHAYGYTDYIYRSHRYYGRSYRGYYRGR